MKLYAENVKHVVEECRRTGDKDGDDEHSTVKKYRMVGEFETNYRAKTVGWPGV